MLINDLKISKLVDFLTILLFLACETDNFSDEFDYEEDVTGLIVEELPPEAVMAKAGLKKGDLIISWEQNLSGSEAKSRPVELPYDIFLLARVYAPHGKVNLHIRRGNHKKIIEVKSKSWNVKVKPILPKVIRPTYLKALKHRKNQNHEEAAAIFTSMANGFDEQKDLACWLYWLAFCEFFKVDREQALQALDKALSLAREHGKELLLPLLLEAGIKLDVDEVIFQRAYEITKDTRNLELAYILHVKAYLAIRSRDFAEGSEYARESLSIKEDLAPNTPDRAITLANLGECEYRLSNYVNAVQAFEEAAGILERSGNSSDFPYLAYSKVGLAASLRAQGNWEAATKILEETSRIIEYGGADTQERYWIELGHLANGRRDHSKALQYYENALDPPNNIVDNQIFIHTAISQVYLEQNDLNRAKRHMQEALTLGERQFQGFDLARLLINAAVLNIQAEDYHQAEDLLRSAGNHLPEDADPRFIALNLRQRGRTLIGLKQYSSAQKVLETAQDILSEIGVEDYELSEVYYYLAKVAQGLGDTANYRGYLEQAIDTIEAHVGAMDAAPPIIAGHAGPGQTFLERAQFAYHFSRYYQDLIELEIEGENWARGFEIGERYRGSVLRRMLGDRGSQPVLIDWQNASQSLEDRTLMLSYLVLEDKTFLFTLARGEEPRAPKIIEWSHDRLDNQVANFQKAILKWKKDPTALQRRGATLYDRLIRPVQDQVDRAERIVLIADGPLRELSFNSLVSQKAENGNGPVYFGLEKPFTRVLSATLFHHRRKGSAKLGGKELRIAAFGNPKLPKEWKLGGLPYTLKEVSTLEEIYSAKTFLREKASEFNLKTLLDTPNILHLACHGVLDDRNPLDSYMALSPGEGEDGKLRVAEIFQLADLAMKMVVLSACDSGRGKMLGGEGLLGMVRAFQYAGAPSVVASQWRVEDEATAVFMAYFYAELFQGLDLDIALLEARIKMVEEHPKYAHPYYWASFDLYGDYR